MSIPATQMRPGMIIKHNGELHSVFKVEHRTPGNLRAFIQAKLRNLRTGAMFEHRFRSPDPIERIVVDEVDMEYLYSDGDDYYFMNTESYEQTHLKRDTLGDAVEYLTPNLQIKVEFYDGKPVGIELPQTVELTVVETEPGLKSATASSVTKPAYIVTGRVQGVGFRWFVEREARALGISGWVRNTDDGAVEVVASGTQDQLSRLRKALAEGPRAARVDDVLESEAQQEAGTSFRIE